MPTDTLRLFVALDLPVAAREALSAFCAAAAEPSLWRPVREEGLHVTLAFLGRRPAGDVDAIRAVLERCARPAPRLRLGSCLLLPPRRARVLTAEIEDPDGALASLQADVSAGLEAAGVFTPEVRPFRAHVTVARIRPRARAPREIAVSPEGVEFPGEAVTLYESRLHPSGARYEPLVRVGLG